VAASKKRKKHRKRDAKKEVQDGTSKEVTHPRTSFAQARLTVEF